MSRAATFRTGTAATAIAAGLALSAPAPATETITYSYDARGRLTKLARTGSVNNGVDTDYQFDLADNRTSRTIGIAPPPPPSNSPPTTVADTLSVARCSTGSKNVIANDSDPEGNIPLVLLNVSSGSKGVASVLNSSTVLYESYDTTGSDPLTYTVGDSLGASSAGTLNVTVTSGGTCQ